MKIQIQKKQFSELNKIDYRPPLQIIEIDGEDVKIKRLKENYDTGSVNNLDELYDIENKKITDNMIKEIRNHCKEIMKLPTEDNWKVPDHWYYNIGVQMTIETGGKNWRNPCGDIFCTYSGKNSPTYDQKLIFKNKVQNIVSLIM